VELVNLLGTKYKFSPRLLAVIRTVPPFPKKLVEDKRVHKFRTKPVHKDDVELAEKSLDSPRVDSPTPASISDDMSHYVIAKQMLHFQSIDVGAHCRFYGAISNT